MFMCTSTDHTWTAKAPSAVLCFPADYDDGLCRGTTWRKLACPGLASATSASDSWEVEGGGGEFVMFAV